MLRAQPWNIQLMSVWPMNALRMYWLVLLALMLSGCSVDADSGPDALWVNLAQADQLQAAKLQQLSDEQDNVAGLVALFGSDSAQVSSDVQRQLRVVGRYLNAHPMAEVRIEGHTDDLGSPEQNAVLAQARAQMVSYYLIKYGALFEQIDTSAYGERYPQRDGQTAQDRQCNRRVVVEWTIY